MRIGCVAQAGLPFPFLLQLVKLVTFIPILKVKAYFTTSS